MKLFFSLFFLFFSFLPFQSQSQALMNYQVYQNMDEFNWENFVNEENIQKHVDFTNELFKELVGFTTANLNADKLHLLRIEQELGLYKVEIKTGLSPEMIRSAEGAIQSHWNNVINIEQQIQTQAGISVPTPELIERFSGAEIKSYRSGVKELYKGDFNVMFNIVEKKDQNLYNSLGQDDELFAEFALPQVEKYTTKMEGIAGAFHSALSSLEQNPAYVLDEDNISTLILMHQDSLEIYNCFQKNFPNPEGENQEALKEMIEGWHEKQSQWGAEALMKAYQYGIRKNPNKVARTLHHFQMVPADTKGKIATFYRDEFLNNPAFINSKDPYKQGARVDALIGLKYLDALEGDEVDLFDKAIEEGAIKIDIFDTNSFSDSLNPLPTLP